MASQAIWGSTLKGKKMLYDQGGYKYHFVKSQNEKTTWYCAERKKQEQCRAYAVVKDDIIITRTDHSHSSLTKQLMAKEIEKKHIDRASENPDLPPRSVLRDISNEYDLI